VSDTLEEACVSHLCIVWQTLLFLQNIIRKDYIILKLLVVLVGNQTQFPKRIQHSGLFDAFFFPCCSLDNIFYSSSFKDSTSQLLCCQWQ